MQLGHTLYGNYHMATRIPSCGTTICPLLMQAIGTRELLLNFSARIINLSFSTCKWIFEVKTKPVICGQHGDELVHEVHFKLLVSSHFGLHK